MPAVMPRYTTGIHSGTSLIPTNGVASGKTAARANGVGPSFNMLSAKARLAFSSHTTLDEQLKPLFPATRSPSFDLATIKEGSFFCIRPPR